jgi:hypothetical protein
VHDISAAIPLQRKVKDHIDTETQSISRGKKHTTPNAELDLRNLASAYYVAKAHKYVPGREFKANQNTVSDWSANGVMGLASKIKTWSQERFTLKSVEEDSEALPNVNT